MKTTDLNNIIQKIFRFFKENLGAPFIFLFQSLLLICSILAILNQRKIVSQVLVYALFFLLVGVLLQTLSFIDKKKEKNNE